MYIIAFFADKFDTNWHYVSNIYVDSFDDITLYHITGKKNWSA